MPHLIMKRSDIPDGTLQILDLKPNTSQRKFPYQKVGQTKYVNAVGRTTPRLVTNAGVISFGDDTSGLEAWFLTHVNDGTGAASTGTATLASVVNGNTLTITTAPAFVLTAAATQTSGNQDFLNSAAAGSDILAADSLVIAINDDANWAAIGIPRPVSADNAGGTSNVVTITALADGAAGDYVLAENTGGTTIIVAGMAGGVDAGPLTAAQAEVDADDVLGLLGFGTTTAAGALTLAAINGALTTGTITAAQLPALLDILAGRAYTVPAGTVISTAGIWGVSPAVGADGGPEYGPERAIYETGALRISFGVGELSKMVGADFSYLGVEAQAVVVYNDDGTLFTV